MRASGSGKDELQTKFSPISPHFFKIILEETLGNYRLQIPNKFVRIYGDTLSDSVCLKLHCGLRWDLGLTKCDGKVWIDKGWKEFSKYYSLGHGNLLVFRYEEKSEFHVLIFDKSTTEIDYPSKPNRFEKHDIDKQPHELVMEETEEGDSVEILEGFSPCPKAREKSPLPCRRSHKRMRTNPVGGTQRPKEGGGEESVTMRWKKPLNEKEKAAQALVGASFAPKDPFFIAVMRPSYVGPRCSLNLPSFFMKNYLQSKRADVILKAPDGRTWNVKYIFGVNKKSPIARFLFGWKAFVQDNNLKVGDICVFVLTKSIGILFEVSIFRKNAENSSMLPEHEASTYKVSSSRQLSCKVESGNTMSEKTEISAPGKSLKTLTHVNEKARALAQPNSCQSKNPFFTVTLGASFTMRQSRFHIPSNFAKTHINKDEGEAILKVSDGRSWSVKYKVRLNGSPTAELCRGWPAFSRANNLAKGDICTFELTNGNDISFKVSIVKSNGRLSFADEKATKPVKEKRNVKC